MGVNLCNLHLIQTVNQYGKELVNALRVAHVNARSIKNKDNLIAEYIDSAQIGFTIITETWLQDNETDQGWVSTTTLNNSNYKMSTENHKTGKGGGISLATSSEYLIKKLNKNTIYDSFKHAVWLSRIRNKDYPLIGIYHPPQGMQQGITVSSSQNSLNF